MPGSINLPQIVLDLEEEDRKRYEAMQPPKSLVCRYGYMKLLAELPYDGTDKPGCGSKLVIRTNRGIELAEMVTTTCPNAGCGQAITRKQMLEYIENSGGKNYPFSTEGKVLRVATAEDLQEQQRLDSRKRAIIQFTKPLIAQLKLPMRLVEVELLLGGERFIFHYTSEQWVDFRELVRLLATEFQTRIEMHQVNARDEARLVADYEKCGQHCCCRQFLKVLKPISMRSAKVQKATLDPTKISGRCGRLMCCLRYEDQTYETLRKRLPYRQTRVKTPDGLGVVIDTQILTQLVMVLLDDQPRPAAYPLENLEILGKDAPRPKPPADATGSRNGYTRTPEKTEPRRPRPGQPLEQEEIESVEDALGEVELSTSAGDIQPVAESSTSEFSAADMKADPQELEDAADQENDGDDLPDSLKNTQAQDVPPAQAQAQAGSGHGEGGRRKRRRRRRRRGRGGEGGGSGNPGNTGPINRPDGGGAN